MGAWQRSFSASSTTSIRCDRPAPIRRPRQASPAIDVRPDADGPAQRRANTAHNPSRHAQRQSCELGSNRQWYLLQSRTVPRFDPPRLLRGFSFAEVEETTEPLATKDTAVRWSDGGRERDHVAQSLVVALGVVMLDELPDYGAQMTLAERDEVPEALLLDRANEPLRVCVQVRAAR